MAQYLRLTVGVLIALGAVQILASVTVFGLKAANPQGFLVALQGLLTVILGVALGGPSNETRALSNPEGRTKDQLTDMLGSLV